MKLAIRLGLATALAITASCAWNTASPPVRPPTRSGDTRDVVGSPAPAANGVAGQTSRAPATDSVIALRRVALTKAAVHASLPPMELLGPVPMDRTKPGEFLRMGLVVDKLFVEGRFRHEGDLLRTPWEAEVLGDGVVVVLGLRRLEAISEADTQIAVVVDENGLVRARRIDLAAGAPVRGRLGGMGWSGQLQGGFLHFHISLRMEDAFPEGLPDRFFVNVAGYGLHPEGDSVLVGPSAATLRSPTTWREVRVGD